MNTIKTTILMALMMIVLVVLGGIVGGKGGALLMFFVSLGMNFFSYFSFVGIKGRTNFQPMFFKTLVA